VTRPGRWGTAPAFLAEILISALLMAVVVSLTGSRWARYTGLVVGALVATYITFEAPLSGMSMNPARSLASAAPGMLWHDLWIYLSAPLLGMLAGAQVFLMAGGARRVLCAKLLHPLGVRCIHCGYEPHGAACGESTAAQPGSARA
jgi:aquaporin Z